MTSFGVLERIGMLKRSNEGGPSRFLHHVVLNLTSSDFKVLHNQRPRWSSFLKRRVVPPKPTVSILDALSFTSAFWVTLILTNKAIYSSLRSMLIKTHRSTIFREPREGLDASTQGDVVFFDCGVIDTTGIIALLEQRADNIIAFYNNNVPLSQMNSSIAYLFGVDTKTNVVNSLKGSKLTQVFGSDLYPVVIANLTNKQVRSWCCTKYAEGCHHCFKRREWCLPVRRPTNTRMSLTKVAGWFRLFAAWAWLKSVVYV